MEAREKLIYVALIAAAAGDLIPTLADAIFFSDQQKQKEKLNEGLVTPKQYWTREAILYYTLNPIYWLLIALIVYNIKGDYHVKAKIAIGLVALGIVIVVIQKNIKKDTEKLNAKLKLASV